MEAPSENPIHTIVLDAGPIIKNEPAISNLLGKAERLTTTPDVIAEIKDEATRTRFDTTWRPFLDLRHPQPQSVTFVRDFAQKTGDLAVLSRTDVGLIALAYELECERNQGDWRLRKVPGQKRTNGPPPPPKAVVGESQQTQDSSVQVSQANDIQKESGQEVQDASSSLESVKVDAIESISLEVSNQANDSASFSGNAISNLECSTGKHLALSDNRNHMDTLPTQETSDDEASASTSDSEGWITPSNIKSKQAKLSNPTSSSTTTTQSTQKPSVMQVAILTSDFAMQNVILQMNLNLLSPNLHRIQHLRNTVLRCHACFNVTKDMAKQFCPRCGQPTLTRVTCTTDANGAFRIHLKQNMQWNKRGDRYSVPKPVSGASNGKVKGGGKGGWGNGLILAEDQKEYVRAVEQEKRERRRDFMDDDFLPSLLSGRRDDQRSGRPKVGAGKNVNSRKR